MNRKNYLYSSGEFAKLTGVNKRTLHYYNEIGLFRPEIIGENGYHYYTCFQFTELELILTLRKIGLSIDEIKDYSSRPSDESFTEMMTKKKKLIDESIEQLLSAQAFLEQKAERLKIGMYSQHGTIERCTLPERKIIFSSPISGEYDEDDFSIAAEFSLRLKKLFHLYDNFGSCISIEDIQKNSFNSYHSFFAYGRLFLYQESAKMYDCAYQICGDKTLIKPYLYASYKYMSLEEYHILITKSEEYMEINAQMRREVDKINQEVSVEPEPGIMEKWKRSHRRSHA